MSQPTAMRRARCRADAAPAARAAARPCSPPTRRGRTRSPPPRTSRATTRAPSRARWRRRSARSRRESRCAPHRQQISEREMQPDAEHQQDDADLGEFVGDRPGRRRYPGVNGPISDRRQRDSRPAARSAAVVRARRRRKRAPGRPRSSRSAGCGAASAMSCGIACDLSYRRRCGLSVASGATNGRQASHASGHHGTIQARSVWGDRPPNAGGNSVRAPSPPASGSSMGSPIVLGVLCGTGAAVFWAAGFVAARHGIAIGFSPADIILHRFVWAGFVFLPLLAREGLGNLGGVGWPKATVAHARRRPDVLVFQLCRVPVRAARPWRSDPALLRRARRTRARDRLC